MDSSRGGISYIKDAATVPAKANIVAAHRGHGVAPSVICLNIIAVALWTVGVFASLYAGYLDPNVRVTSSTLSSIINGGATIAMALFIDPYMSAMTDDVVEGKITQSQFRKAVVCLVGSRLAGTLLAQLLFVPAAGLIAYVAAIL